MINWPVEIIKNKPTMLQFGNFQSVKIKLIIIIMLLIVAFMGLLFFLGNKNSTSENPWGDNSYIEAIAEEIPFTMPSFKIYKAPANVCDIKNYGSIGDGIFLNTTSIKKAIEDCSQKGGGTVVFPSGKWLTGPIRLKNNINLHLEKNSEIIFTTDLNDYLPVVFTKFQGMEYYNFSPPIYAKDCENVALTGKGKIFGNGAFWAKWARTPNSETERERLFQMAQNNVPTEERIFGQTDSGLRPSFIQFVNCKNIFIEGLTIEDGPMWTIHPIYSENILIRNVNINTYSMNTDGIAIESSKNVLVENSNFSTGDDAIAIKSGLENEGLRLNRPSENIVIQNSNFTESHGSVAIGSEMSGGVRNVIIKNSVFNNSGSGLRIKSTSSRGGFIENIWLDNVKMNDIEGAAVVFNFRYSSALKTKDAEASRIPVIRNIFIKNVSGNSLDKAIDIFGLKDGMMENIHFENIELRSKNGSEVKYAKNIEFKNIFLKTASSEPSLLIENSQSIRFNDFKCENIDNLCLNISGIQTVDIDLSLSGIKKDAVSIENGLEKQVKLD